VASSLKGEVRGGRDSSVLWRMLSDIHSGVGVGVESWFKENVRRVMGDGSSTYFWLDNWVGGAPLRVQFPRLFDLIQDKGATVREMEEKGWAVGGGAWVWRRRLLAWGEESDTECTHCYLTFFCRTLLLTGGDGFLILFKDTLSEGLINISHHLVHFRSGAVMIWCG